MITDYRGKILRNGDRVHKVSSLRSIRKKAPNGRVLPTLRAFTVKIVDGIIQIKGKNFIGADLIKE